jgi:hypothetical protein
VLTPAAYALLRVISFSSIGGGVLLLAVGAIRHERGSGSMRPH